MKEQKNYKNSIKFYQSPTIIIGLTLFLALVIGTIYRINTAFITYPGLVANDPYHAGKNYGESRVLTDKLKQQGYKLTLKKHNFIEIDKEFTYIVDFNKNGVIVKNSQVRFYFYRPLEEQYDFEENAIFENNLWILKTKLPRKGKWRVVVEANFDGNKLNIFNKIFVNDKL